MFPADTPLDDIRSYWMGDDKHTYVAEQGGRVVGAFVFRQNRIGLGSHIGNASYIVDPDYHGRGIGKSMGLYSLSEAKKLGFHALQFNMVVSTNAAAVKLWQALGFKIMGTIPKAFRHKNHGLVDVYIMYRSLDDV